MHRNIRGLGLSVSAALLAGLLNVAMPQTAAFGQSGDNSTAQKAAPEPAAPANNAAPAAPSVAVTIPNIESVGSSIDEAGLRAIFSGDVASHADALAHLSATSIKIPELHVSYDVPVATGAPKKGELVYKDIEIAMVANGVAATVSMGGAEVTGTDGTKFTLGKVSANSLDIGGLLGFYGLVQGSGETAPKTLYKNFAADGASLGGPDFNCKIGKISVAELKARPLKLSFSDFIALIQQMDAQKEHPAPETVSKFVSFYIDFLRAVEISPVAFSGFDCSGKSDDGKPVTVSLGSTTMGAFGHGRYPEIDASDVKIGMEQNGEISLGNILLKGFDYSAPISVIESATAPLDDAWFQANARKLIPAFEGVSFSDFKMDVADTDHPGQRIKAAVGNFDLSLHSYINGVPSDISTSASHLVVDLPTDETDDSLKQLHAMGIEKIDAGYDFAARWDETSQSIKVGKLSFSGVDLGSIALAGTIGNATRNLFSDKNDLAVATAMGLSVKDIKLDVLDAGMVGMMLKSAATEQGQDVEKFRVATSGMTQGAILAILGATDEAKKLSDAVGSFLNGAKTLSIAITAKDPAGIGMADFMAVQADPTALVGKVNIDASAK
jgi:hypothetical protein